MKQRAAFIVSGEVAVNICLLSLPSRSRLRDLNHKWRISGRPDMRRGTGGEGGREHKGQITFAVATKFCEKAVA